ncbi:hypothetical protein F7725_027999 [Dissostichus mawsoni]|uniref:Mitochondrial import inner membrane translocase subunit TIM14 n=1 Tax=Dissostichus mawsoni TaxID=36200 RepID=A0A7J5XES2_DISMA|nr:hypothetical protein F7725_027999 [Dissostichus mawsoni]
MVREASSMVAVGLALAAAGYAGRYAMKAMKQMEPQMKMAIQSFPKTAFGGGYYKGGFDPKMSKREASLVLGVSPTANKIKVREAHRKLMTLNHPDRVLASTCLQCQKDPCSTRRRGPSSASAGSGPPAAVSLWPGASLPLPVTRDQSLSSSLRSESVSEALDCSEFVPGRAKQTDERDRHTDRGRGGVGTAICIVPSSSSSFPPLSLSLPSLPSHLGALPPPSRGIKAEMVDGRDSWNFARLLDVAAVAADGQAHQIRSDHELLLEGRHQLPGGLHKCFVASWLRDISSSLVLMLRRCMSLSKDTRFTVASLLEQRKKSHSLVLKGNGERVIVDIFDNALQDTQTGLRPEGKMKDLVEQRRPEKERGNGGDEMGGKETASRSTNSFLVCGISDPLLACQLGLLLTRSLEHREAFCSPRPRSAFSALSLIVASSPLNCDSKRKRRQTGWQTDRDRQTDAEAVTEENKMKIN